MKELESYFIQYWKKTYKGRRSYYFKVEFYPYRSMFVKIFRKRDHLLLRFSVILRDAPVEVLKAGGREMIHRLIGLRPLVTDRTIFRQYINNLQTVRKEIAGADYNPESLGNYKNLKQYLDVINNRHFGNSLDIKGIGWTLRPVKSYYAKYLLGYKVIKVNCAFDNPRVPDFVIEYLVYHEALHSIYPVRMIKNRFFKHTGEFRRKEKEFEKYNEAKVWLRQRGKTLLQNISR